jgi:chromosome segregation ATPase
VTDADDIVREALRESHTDGSEPFAALDRLVAAAAVRCSNCAAVEDERDRWRAVACNVKDGTQAAEAERDEARRERDEWKESFKQAAERGDHAHNRREAAEAENARLTQRIGLLDDEAESLGREADRLREVVEQIAGGRSSVDSQLIARAALEAPRD